MVKKLCEKNGFTSYEDDFSVIARIRINLGNLLTKPTSSETAHKIDNLKEQNDLLYQKICF